MIIKFHNNWELGNFTLIDFSYEKYGVMTNHKHELWFYLFNFGLIFAWGGEYTKCVYCEAKDDDF